MQEKKVTRVEFPECGKEAPGKLKKKRVVAYARVSTMKDTQENSLQSQQEYFIGYIKRHPDWEYCGIYTDDGISGLSARKREGFTNMVADGLAGKFDLILTKSLSRFARNTVDALTTIRNLKSVGVAIYFQKENIMTFDSKGELMITIMSSLAQEESRSISENVTWGQRKRFADGKVSMPYGQFLGYRKGADGLPEIVPEEAEIVRYIYRLLIQGASTNSIAARLTEENIPTPGGKKKWQWATVESILRNEKYKGSALLQKSFTVDFLTKKTKVNEGEVPQYFVEESHPAIIEPWAWEQVQLELERRKKHRNRTRQTSCFAGKIFCGDCGEIFGSKVWHSTDKYRRVIWRCNAKFGGTEKCQTPHVTEDQIKALFLEALGVYFSDRDQALEQLRYAKKALTDTDFIDADIQQLEVELDILADAIRSCINDNASNTMDEAAYRAKHNELCIRFEDTEKHLAALREEREQMDADAVAIGGMMFELMELESLPLEFSEKLWNGTIERVMVYADKRMVFRFKDGKEVVTIL